MSLFVLSLLATFINGIVLIAGANEPYENTNDELAIKDVILKFYDTKYQSLSVLEEKDISIFWKTNGNPEYELEAASLSIDVNHRKIQPLDLRFEKYNLKMDFKKINVFSNKAEVKVVENSQIYQNASPDVCSELGNEHIIKLEKINGKWFIISDSSNDTTKKDLLLRIATGKTIQEAKKEILENSKHEVMIYNQQKLALAAPTHKVCFVVGYSYYTVDGQTKQMDAESFMNNDRTYVPIRYLALALGVAEKDIIWQFPNVILRLEGTELKLTVNSKTLYINDQAKQMDVAVLNRIPHRMDLVNGRTYLPARWVAEAFGYKVDWKPENGAALVYPPNQDPPEVVTKPPVSEIQNAPFPVQLIKLEMEVGSRKAMDTRPDGSKVDVTLDAALPVKGTVLLTAHNRI
jgi:hypothetical protein